MAGIPHSFIDNDFLNDSDILICDDEISEMENNSLLNVIEVDDISNSG